MFNKIGPMTDALIDACIKQLKKKETKEKIHKNVLEPILHDISSRYYPYFMIILTILILIVTLLCIILILMIVKNKSN